VALLAAVATLAGCATPQPDTTSQRRAVVSSHQEHELGTWASGARSLALAALFSAVVYRDERERQPAGSICALAPPIDAEDGMPNGEGADGYRWVRWSESATAKGVGCVEQAGLFAEVYVLRDRQEQPVLAVLAYRGTEGLTDWLTNFSAPLGVEPRQYLLAGLHLQRFLEVFSERHRQVPIFAVGHSLGGGLAQQAAYLSSSITAAIVFNTSPVTNYTKLEEAERLLAEGWGPEHFLGEDGRPQPGAPELERPRWPDFRNPGHTPKVIRVHHDGEVLEPVRRVTTAVTSLQVNRVDVELSLGIGANQRFRPVKAHSIPAMVCRLMREVTKIRELPRDREEIPGFKVPLPAYLPAPVAGRIARGESSMEKTFGCRKHNEWPATVKP
jgi:hypothetical protein